jgi:hypothetical protein
MELRLQLNEAFKDRFCTIDWLEKDNILLWQYKIETFDLEIKKAKSGFEVVHNIFNRDPNLINKKFTLSLRQYISEQSITPIYVLYYSYE